ncbi:MAG: type IV pilus assembly protein PilM [Chitinivibrionales bacterium]|nr:type IV pilus assembly protein PilM [Chitinivibrionales bacterium]
MKLMKIGKQISTTGLDIGSHSIKLVKINHAKGKLYLEAVGIKELKQGIIENGTIKDNEGLVEAVTTLISQCDPSITDIVISMSGYGILSEKFTFKVNANENLEEVILWEAGQRSPFDVDDITLDYKIIKQFPEKNEVEVLIIAAKNVIMQKYIDLLYEAGFRPIIIDVDAFAIYNCFSMESNTEPLQGTMALLNIGHSLTTITFIKDGVYHSTRDIATAGSFFCQTLQRNLNISYDEAADVLKGVRTKGCDENMVTRAIEYASEELSSGIDLAFSYFKNSEKSEKIDKIILSGGGAYIPNIVKYLEERHNTQVKLSNPLAYLNHEPGLFGTVNPQKISAFLTVAIGLALRKAVN